LNKLIPALFRSPAGRNIPGRLLWLLSLLLAALPAGALDFGLVFQQDVKLSNEAGEGAFVYTPALIPWVSGPLGKQFNLYLSGRIGLEYTNFFDGGAGTGSGWRDPAVLPEADRAELSWQVSPALSLTLGRQQLRDPAGLVAAGFFDGIGGVLSAGGSRFSGGVYYTGFLYKDTADIIMTGRDREEHGRPLSFEGDYFASRRLLAAFEWEKPDLSPRSSLVLGLLAQFDLNGEDEQFHSQYLSARYGVRLPRGFGLEGSGALAVGENQRGDALVFFAGALGLNWTLPGALDDRLSLGGIYSSPSQGKRLGPFVPVNSVPRGQVFSPAIGGISALRGAYALRLRPTLMLEAEGSYFIRTDTVSFRDDQEPEHLKGEGYFLGGELYGTVRWTPLPDLALVAGGGAFFPRLGNAFATDADVRWKGVAGIVLSF
jgi:hypothetical protein